MQIKLDKEFNGQQFHQECSDNGIDFPLNENTFQLTGDILTINANGNDEKKIAEILKTHIARDLESEYLALAKNKKSLLLEKLGITEEEAKLLLS